MSDWVVTAPAPAGRYDGIGDYAARLATALRPHVPTQVIVAGLDALPEPDQVAGVLYQYSPPHRSTTMTRWLDALVARQRPLVVTVHEYWSPAALSPRRMLSRSQLRRHLTALAAQASAMVLTQEISARELRGAGVIDAQPTAVIPVGSNIVRAPGHPPRDGGLVIFGQPAALQTSVLAAVARWMAESADRPPLTWIGRSSVEMQDAWRAVAGADAARVTCVGGAEEAVVSGILQRATMGLAHYENGASAKRTTLAALLQHGVPTVATIGIATDMWLRGTTGLWPVPDGDADAFVRAVDQLWNDAAARERLSRGAQTLHDAHMDWTRIANAYAELITTLTKDFR